MRDDLSISWWPSYLLATYRCLAQDDADVGEAVGSTHTKDDSIAAGLRGHLNLGSMCGAPTMGAPIMGGPAKPGAMGP